jgi:signal transduction histidine kinase
MTRKVPPLRRRLALTLALVAVAGYLTLSAAVFTVINVRLSFENAGYGACTQLPFLPHLAQGCIPAYSPLVRIVLLVLLVAGLMLAGWGCWRLAARLLRPLTALAGTVSQLGPQNLGQRIRMTGAADPLKELADAVDAALDQLVAGYESQRKFASNASHELRTQLAVQRLLTEVAMDDPDSGPDLHRLGGQLVRANERNEKLIEGLLGLAESERGLPARSRCASACSPRRSWMPTPNWPPSAGSACAGCSRSGWCQAIRCCWSGSSAISSPTRSCTTSRTAGSRSPSPPSRR